MKLTKSKLIKLLNPRLEKSGYTFFKDTSSGAQGVFCKKISSELYLTLALTIHRYYESAFVGEFTFSKTTIPFLSWGDIPNEMNKRIGHLLTDSERSSYVEDEINAKSAKDIWFNGGDADSVLDFIKVIEITEPRIVNDRELIEKVNQSKDVTSLASYSKRVKELVLNDKTEGTYSFLPTKEIDGIPIIWFKASEKVLRENKEILNAHTVKRLAADAYRQSILDNLD